MLYITSVLQRRERKRERGEDFRLLLYFQIWKLWSWFWERCKRKLRDFYRSCYVFIQTKFRIHCGFPPVNPLKKNFFCKELYRDSCTYSTRTWMEGLSKIGHVALWAAKNCIVDIRDFIVCHTFCHVLRFYHKFYRCSR